MADSGFVESNMYVFDYSRQIMNCLGTHEGKVIAVIDHRIQVLLKADDAKYTNQII